MERRFFDDFFFAVAEVAGSAGAAAVLPLDCCGGSGLAADDGARQNESKSAAENAMATKNDERESFGMAQHIFVLCRK